MPTDSSAPADGEEDAALHHHSDDGLLAQRVAAGDRESQRRLVQRLLPLCRRICGALVRDPIDADDATHVGLLEVLRSVAGFRGDTALEGWAQRIVVRSTMRFIDGQRRVRRQHDDDVRVSQVRAPSAAGRALDELPRSLESYVDELPEPQGQAVLLRHALGCTVAEIAELTGVSPNTAKARLLHGRRTLRRLIRRDLNLGVGKPEARR